MLIVFLFALIFLFREQTSLVPGAASTGEKALSADKVEESAAPVEKENQNPKELDYNTAAAQNTISAYKEYIDKNPSESHVKEAENNIKELQKMPEDIRIVASKASRGIKLGKNEEGLWEADCGEGILMVYIPPGKFIMGSDEDDLEGVGEEQPSHEVYLDGYWIGKYEVTFDQYDKFCAESSRDRPGDSDAGWGRGKRPAINVSWYDAEAYCRWLSAKTGLNFKLPTEAQWEKAARGTEGQRFPWGNQEANEKLANFGNDSEIRKTNPVGSYPQGESPYGLMDMAGNVWEWCYDWYGSYSAEPQKNPTGPQTGHFRVLRGGSWFDSPMYIRCSIRFYAKPSYRGNIEGFRLCQEN